MIEINKCSPNANCADCPDEKGSEPCVIKIEQAKRRSSKIEIEDEGEDGQSARQTYTLPKDF